MKILKIILGVFCIALTVNAFKDGLEPNEGFLFYLPIIVVFIIGIALFKSALKAQKK